MSSPSPCHVEHNDSGTPRNRCHLNLYLNPQLTDDTSLLQYEIQLGLPIDPLGTKIAESAFVSEWITNDTIAEFLTSIEESTWLLLNEIIDRFDGELLLSVEIWFSRPPALVLGKEVLRKAVKYNFTFDFDLYPLTD